MLTNININTLFTTPEGEIHYPLYILLFAGSFVITWIMTRILIAIAPKIGAIDTPQPRKVHRTPVPRLGGLAIAIAFIIMALVAMVLHPHIAEVMLRPQNIAIFVGLLIMLLLGIYDDLFRTSWMWKFAFQIVAASIVIRHKLLILQITNPFGPTIKLGVLIGFIFTLIWLIGITNAVNLSDGLDGLATGIVMIVCGVTFANSLHLMVTRPEQYELFIFPAVTSACVLGAAIAFLRFNFYPARIFLGDTGSLFLGFLIACMAVSSAQISTTTVALLVPVIALGLPILDTTLAFFRRTAKRRNPFRADMEHIHHKLLSAGLSHPQTVLILYGFCIILGLAALILAMKMNHVAGIVLLVLTVLTLIGFKKFGVFDVTGLWGERNTQLEDTPATKSPEKQ